MFVSFCIVIFVWVGLCALNAFVQIVRTRDRRRFVCQLVCSHWSNLRHDTGELQRCSSEKNKNERTWKRKDACIKSWVEYSNIDSVQTNATQKIKKIEWNKNVMQIDGSYYRRLDSVCMNWVRWIIDLNFPGPCKLVWCAVAFLPGCLVHRWPALWLFL